MIPPRSEKISWKYIYRKLYYNRDIRTTLRHFWIVSWWQRYFWISVPLTHHYKKCPVMWMIIELISKHPEISLSSRNDPEMSQHSSDVPIVVKFSIYIFPWDLLWSGWYHLKNIFLHWVQCFSLYQNSLKNRKCLNFLMFLQDATGRFTFIQGQGGMWGDQSTSDNCINQNAPEFVINPSNWTK